LHTRKVLVQPLVILLWLDLFHRVDFLPYRSRKLKPPN
jgi:hypothetical protein